MSFDHPPLEPGQARPRIAVIGGGITGMMSARTLSSLGDVTLYEAEPRLGGHARTVMAGRDGSVPVDTGFIVFNYANYPHLTTMFRDLGVRVEKSCMSFGASIDDGRLEYGLKSLDAVFGQRRNLARPRFWTMLRDIHRFNTRAEALARSDDMTVDDLVGELGLGAWFRHYYLMPICGAIWSTPSQTVGAFPARSLVRFFRNHALLSATGQHQWYTVSGGSVEYVRRLTADLARRGVDIRAGTPVARVVRGGARVTVIAKKGGLSDTFDHVVMACHSDQALKMLDRPSPAESRILGAIRYQDNTTFLHRDTALMPRERRCWSSWVYSARSAGPPDDRKTGLGVTYWMNRLQNLPEADPLFVSLNPTRPIRDDDIYDQVTFRHPVFDTGALAAQRQLASLQGNANTWFAGAWARHGFHEDGCAAAMRVARAMADRLARTRRGVAA